MSGRDMLLRDIDPACDAEIAVVAERMRLTLMEVVGTEAGEAMYTMDWLVQRVRFHLDPGQCRGRVIVAEAEGEIVGHTILRRQTEETWGEFGLFSTFYVVPEWRRRGVADRFVTVGEAWFLDEGLPQARTYTAHDNRPLHGLMERHGYAIDLRRDDMVSFVKTLGRQQVCPGR